MLSNFINIIAKATGVAAHSLWFGIYTALPIVGIYMGYRYRTQIQPAYNATKQAISEIVEFIMLPFITYKNNVSRQQWQRSIKKMEPMNDLGTNFNVIKSLLYLNPVLVNHREVVFNEEVWHRELADVSLLDMAVAKSPPNFELIRILIAAGAHFDDCPSGRYMHKKCTYLTRTREPLYAGDYFKNSLYYISAYINSISNDSADKATYNFALTEYKKTLDLICEKNGANHMLRGGIPILSLMPNWDLADYLIKKGADPKLKAPGLNSLDALDTLLEACEYKRLDKFIDNGLIPEIKVSKFLRKDYKTNNIAYILQHPVLSKQLSDIEKAQCLCMVNYKDQDLDTKYYFGADSKTGALWLKDVIAETAKISEDIIKILISGDVMMALYHDEGTKETSKSIKAYWDQKNPEIFKDLSHFSAYGKEWELEKWQCLPEGYIPRLRDGDLFINPSDPSNDYKFNSDRAFDVLEIEPTTDKKAILNAFKKVALKFHPDKNTGPWAEHANVEFQCITRAKDILLKNQ